MIRISIISTTNSDTYWKIEKEISNYTEYIWCTDIHLILFSTNTVTTSWNVYLEFNIFIQNIVFLLHNTLHN